MTTQQLILQSLIMRFGRPAVAARLNVPGCVLEDWLFGNSRIPDAKFLLLVEEYLTEPRGKPH